MFGGQGLTWILTTVTLALLPRYLGPRHMGEIGIALSFSSLAATVAGLGMATLITREVARGRDQVEELLATAFWLNVVLGSCGGAVAIAAGMALGYAPMTLFAITVLAVTVPFDLLILFGFSALQGAEVMRHQALIDTANKLLSLAALGLIIFFDLGVVAYLGFSFLSAALCAGSSVWVMWQYLPFHFHRFAFRRAWWLVKESVPLGAVNVVVVVYLAVDVLLLSLFAGEGAVGIYTTPSRIWGTLLFVPTIIMTVVFPRMAASTRDNTDGLAPIAARTLQVIVGVTLPVAVLTAGAGRDLLATLIGPEFAKSGPVLAVMALALVPTGVNMACHRILVAGGRQRTWMLVMAGALPLKLILNLAFIPLFAWRFDSPALGAAVGLAAAEASIMAAGLRLLPHGTVDRASRRLATRLLVAAALSAAVMVIARGQGPVVAGFVGVLGYAAGVMACRAYTVRELVAAVRWFAGRSVQAPSAMILASPLGGYMVATVDDIDADPLTGNLARMKGIHGPRRPLRRVV